jgi:hypothetical protein
MSVIGLLGRLLGNLGRIVGRALGIEKTGIEPARLVPGTTPAVAVLAWRHRQDPFLLARRIASVARLNVPFGRKPAGTKSRFQGLPPVPRDRLGAKRTRINGNRGPRVLVRTAPRVSTAAVIPFPVAAARDTTTANRARRAA